MAQGMWSGIRSGVNRIQDRMDFQEKLKLQQEQQAFREKIQQTSQTRQDTLMQQQKDGIDRQLKREAGDQMLAMHPEYYQMMQQGQGGALQGQEMMSGAEQPANPQLEIARGASARGLAGARDYRTQEQLSQMRINEKRAGRAPVRPNTPYKTDAGVFRTGADGKEVRLGGLPPKSKTEINVAPESKFKNESTLRKEFAAVPAVKDYAVVQKQAGRVKAVMDMLAEVRSSGKGTLVAVDQALITIFNKMLDETSVVRESEYARTSEDISFLNRVKGAGLKLLTGGAGLTDEERKSLTYAIGQFGAVTEKLYNKQKGYFGSLATRYGFDPDRVVNPNSGTTFKEGQGQETNEKVSGYLKMLD